MVNKKPKVIKTNQDQSLKSVNEEQPHTSNVLASSTPQTGSPTTGDSGLVTVNKKPRSKTPRQKANVTSNTIPNTEDKKTVMVYNGSNKSIVPELRISQKRQLVTSITRRYTRAEPIVNKVMRFLVDRNIVTNEKQLASYLVDIPVNSIGHDLSLLIKPDQKSDVNSITNQTQDLKKIFKEVKVTQPKGSILISITLDGYIEPVTKTTNRKK